MFQEALEILETNKSSPVILTHVSFDDYQQDFCQSSKKSPPKLNLLQMAGTEEIIDLCDQTTASSSLLNDEGKSFIL